MNLESYEIKAKDSLMIFEFISEGTKGCIRKRVHFPKSEDRGFFNLAFGDITTATNSIDDKVVSNNFDRDKVLATVAKIVTIFLKKYPNAYVIAEGSTVARNRLYQIAISKNLEEVKEIFNIYGYLEPIGWVRFEKNNNYSAFLIFKNE